ncbi:hypothetical protein ACWGII_41160 [Streptomyces sp. NPDC054855]
MPSAHIIGQQDGEEEDRRDPSDLIPAVIRKLPGFEPADHAPDRWSAGTS